MTQHRQRCRCYVVLPPYGVEIQFYSPNLALMGQCCIESMFGCDYLKNLYQDTMCTNILVKWIVTVVYEDVRAA